VITELTAEVSVLKMCIGCLYNSYMKYITCMHTQTTVKYIYIHVISDG